MREVSGPNINLFGDAVSWFGGPNRCEAGTSSIKEVATKSVIAGGAEAAFLGRLTQSDIGSPRTEVELRDQKHENKCVTSILDTALNRHRRE